MTPCPICRQQPELISECLCDEGYVSAEMIQNHQPTARDNAIFWTVTIAALVPWALLIWRGMR